MRFPSLHGLRGFQSQAEVWYVEPLRELAGELFPQANAALSLYQYPVCPFQTTSLAPCLSQGPQITVLCQKNEGLPLDSQAKLGKKVACDLRKKAIQAAQQTGGTWGWERTWKG